MIPRAFTETPRVKASDREDVDGDPQQAEVYALERSFAGGFHHTELPEFVLQDIADYVCRKARVPRINIEINDAARPKYTGIYWPKWAGADARLVLSRWRSGCTALVLAHELAHHIHDSMAEGTEEQPHGPEFMGIYRRVLDRLNIIPAYAFDAACAHWGLRVTRYTKVRDL